MIRMLWFTAYVLSVLVIIAAVLSLVVVFGIAVALSPWYLLLLPVSAFLIVCSFRLAGWCVDMAYYYG